MSVSKVNKSSTIIRRPDYARKDIDDVTQVEVSNQDAKLDNNLFNDLVFLKKDKKQDKKEQKTEHQQENLNKEPSNKNKDGQTDFYV